MQSPAAEAVTVAVRVPAAGLTVPTRQGPAVGLGLREAARQTPQATLRLLRSWLQQTKTTR